MSAHTPGPWVTGNTDPLLFGVQRGPGTEPIGFVYGPSFPERSEIGLRALANARLIAAAPTMLNALIAADEAMAGSGLLACHATRKEIAAAIAAAKGEQ